VLGRATHAVLRWRLESGERCGTLDVLAGSTSLTSTIMSLLQLRMVTFLGLSLAITWTLSPIGGQASFRQVTTGNMTSNHTTSFDYMVPDGNLGLDCCSDRMLWWEIIDTMYKAAVVSPRATKESPLDLWGNVKIPLVEALEDAVSADKDGWFKVNTEQTSTTTFASLLGVPMAGLDDKDAVNMNMNLQTLYLSLDCKRVPRYQTGWKPQGAFLANTSYNAIGWDDTFSIAIADNGSTPGPVRQIPFQFYFGSSWWNVTNGNLQCQMTSTYVEVEVFCPIRTTCAVSKIRRSRLSHPPAAQTQLDFDTAGAFSNWPKFASYFIRTFQAGYHDFPTMLDLYLMAPEDPLLVLQTPDYSYKSFDEYEPFTKKPPALDKAYSYNLGQLFNTYWTCMNGFYALTGGLTNATSYTDDNTSFAGLAMNQTKNTTERFKTRAWSTVGTKNTEEIVIQAHKGWAAVLVFASSLLILASLVPAVFRTFLTNGPDIMMNMSSLVMRDNLYVALPPTGSFLEASDRARILKDVKIRFGDAKSTSEVGRLAVGSVGDSEGWTIGRVKRHRLCE
jgi:hypothetical protein